MLLALLACPAPTAEERFAADVVPVLDRSCGAASCHGTAPGEEPLAGFAYPVDAEGWIEDVAAAREAALVYASALEPEQSSMLRKPLGVGWGGVPHYGGDNLVGPGDEDYVALRTWLHAEHEGGEDPEPLDDLERQFAEEVQPALVGMTCLNASCHGAEAAVPFRFDGGVQGWIGTAGTRANHAAARKMLALDGDPTRSRLLRKALPLHADGVLHKGGNDAFLVDPDDPRAQAILDWACAEREALGLSCQEAVEAFVFVQGPLVAEPAWQLDAWNPGTELVLADLEGEVLEVLTEGLHEGLADIRAPAVDPSGRRVLFTMRRSEAEGHAVWLLDLDSGEAEQLTSPEAWHDRDPAWGPEGRVWFVSDRDGGFGDAGTADPELYALDLEDGSLQRRSWTPHAERKPTAYAVGPFGHEIAFTTLRAAVPDQAVAHPFRFPPSLAAEYHQHYGVTAPESNLWDTRELADGRFLTILGELDNAWVGGQPAVLDRNFGPGMEEATTAEPGLPFFADPMTRLDEDAASSGRTTLYRDPAGLPDGRVLWARSVEPIDLGDPTAEPEMVVELVELAESVDGSGPHIVSRRTLVAGHDPEPVVRRPPPERDEPQWDPAAETGLLLHNGLPLIDALLSNLPPSGPKEADPEIVAVRLVEPLDLEREPVEGLEGATTTGIPPRSPARVLIELPLAPDGSFQVELPAGTAFRIQALDGQGMSVGADHNRWMDVAPGQTIRQGLSASDPRHYAARCAACHGGLDGDPASVFVAPDVMTAASFTLSRYEQGDPRRPLEPPLAGEATRIEVDFVEDVQPILQARCQTCHAEVEPGLGDRETEAYDEAYEALVATGWVGARAVDSPLTELLLDGHGELDEEELLTLLRWMDLGASWRGRE